MGGRSEKKVEKDYKQQIGNTMQIAILASFVPDDIKDYIYVNVQPDTEYATIIDKVKALIRNKVTTGRTLMDFATWQHSEMQVVLEMYPRKKIALLMPWDSVGSA